MRDWAALCQVACPLFPSSVCLPDKAFLDRTFPQEKAHRCPVRRPGSRTRLPAHRHLVLVWAAALACPVWDWTQLPCPNSAVSWLGLGSLPPPGAPYLVARVLSMASSGRHGLSPSCGGRLNRGSGATRRRPPGGRGPLLTASSCACALLGHPEHPGQHAGISLSPRAWLCSPVWLP